MPPPIRPRPAIRLLWIPVTIGSLLPLGWFATFDRSSDRKALDRLANEATAAVIGLERALGFGGLIHNFKNYVLRPAEASYREQALADADRALGWLSELERACSEAEIPIETSEVRAMIVEYRGRLDRVADLRTAGASIETVDREVRYPDEPALEQLGTSVSMLLSELDAELERGAARERRQVLGLALSQVAVVCVVGLFVLRERHRRQLDEVIAELETSNRALGIANETLDRAATITSHELKAPVRRMSVFGSMVVEDAAFPEIVREHGDSIQQAAAAMMGTLERTLAFARHGVARPDLTRVLPAQVAERVVDTVTADLIALDGEVAIQPMDPVWADDELLARVYDNLLRNSIKYRDPERPLRLVLGSRPHGSQVELFVADNGRGIPIEQAERLFEPFERGRNEISVEGSGVGLAIVRSIIQGHGGRVWVDTSTIQGATIRFTLDPPRG